MFSRHERFVGAVAAAPERVFNYLDDQTLLSAHMSKRSWKMGWGKMNLSLDDKRGKEVGSHIRLEGRVLGIRLFLEEVVTEREPPIHKSWETTEEPKLLVIGSYRMTFDVSAHTDGSAVSVSIDYDLPARGFSRLAGRIFGRSYAHWCTRKMVLDAKRTFAFGLQNSLTTLAK